MDFYAILDQVTALLRQRQRVTYRALQRQFGFDDAYLEDLKAELIDAQRLAADEEGKVLVWMGDPAPASPTASAPTPPSHQRAADLHAVVSRGKSAYLTQCPRRRTQAGYGAVCGHQRLNGTDSDLDPEGRPDSSSIPARHDMMDGCAPFRGHGQSGLGGRHHVALWGPHRP